MDARGRLAGDEDARSWPGLQLHELRVAIEERLVPRDGQPVVRRLMTLTLTFDHRAVDGAPAARFLARLRELLERPYLILL